MKNIKEQCQSIWDHYLSRRLDNGFEPTWVHEPYQIVKDFIDDKTLNNEQSFLLQEIIKSHLQKDGTEVPVKMGFPNEGIRLMHDSWKAGSFTWIFMGRKFCEDVFSYKNNVIINRKLPDEIYDLTDREAPQVLYASYNLNENLFAGPAITLEQLLRHIDQSH